MKRAGEVKRHNTAEHHPGCLNDNCRDRAHHHRVMGFFCGGNAGDVVVWEEEEHVSGQPKSIAEFCCSDAANIMAVKAEIVNC